MLLLSDALICFYSYFSLGKLKHVIFLFAVRCPSHAFYSGQRKYTNFASATPLLSTNFVCQAPLRSEILSPPPLFFSSHLFMTLNDFV